MPIKLGPDGRPMQVPTQRRDSARVPTKSRKLSGRSKAGLGDEATGPPRGRAKNASAGKRQRLGLWEKDEETTRLQRSRSAPANSGDLSGQSPPGGDARTRFGRQGRRSGKAEQPEERAPAELVDLPTGWLVVVDGPGRGATLPLGFGHNTIGRGAGMRVRLNFGDDEISREHTAIRYSDRNNTFNIFPGNNNVYLADAEEVLVPTPLVSGACITVGQTTLRFVPFCDESFRWD